MAFEICPAAREATPNIDLGHGVTARPNPGSHALQREVSASTDKFSEVHAHVGRCAALQERTHHHRIGAIIHHRRVGQLIATLKKAGWSRTRRATVSSADVLSRVVPAPDRTAALQVHAAEPSIQTTGGHAVETTGEHRLAGLGELHPASHHVALGA